MGAYGSPELKVTPARYAAGISRSRRRRRWPWFLLGVGATLAAEFTLLMAAATVSVVRG